MIEDEEQGFLSHKFNDFGSEPIPNGWSAIDKQLAKGRRRRSPIGWFASGILLLIFAGLGVWQFNQTLDLQQIATIEKPGMESNANSQKSSKLQSKEIATHSQQETGTTLENGNLAKENESASNDKGDLTNPNSSNTNQNLLSIKTLETGPEAEVENLKTEKLPTKEFSQKKRKSPAISTPFIAQIAAENQDNPNLSANSESKTKGTKKRKNLKAIDGSNNEFPPSQSILNEPFAYISEPKKSPNNNTNSSEPGLDPIEHKTPLLLIGEPLTHGQLLYASLFSMPSDSQISKKPTLRNFSFWAGGSLGYTQKTISVDQTETSSRIDMGNSFQSEPNLMTQVQGKMTYMHPNLGWLQLLSGLSIGVYQQNINLQSSTKQPIGFSFQMKDSLHYSVDPNWTNLDESRKQQLIFANFELGIKPLISRSRQSGPFASVLVWTRLSEKNTTSSNQGLGFEEAKSSLAIGYKLGYQHLLTDKWQFEIFTTALPQNLISSRQGISIRPQFFGIGINRKVW